MHLPVPLFKKFYTALQVLALVWATGCLSKKENLSSKTEEATTNSSYDDETANVPNNVSGVYLTCANQQTASASTPESVVGCYFGNQQGSRLAVNDVASGVQFGFKPPNTSKAVTSVVALTNDPLYDVVYLTQSDNLDEINTTVQNTMVSAILANLKNGKSKETLGDTLPNLTKSTTPSSGGPTAVDYTLSTQNCAHSINSDEAITLVVKNLCSFAVDVVWLDYQCAQYSYGQLQNNDEVWLSTYVTHPWRVFRVSTGVLLQSFTATSEQNKLIVLCE